MKKYRLLIHGRNFLIDVDGKPKKQGFYQNVFIYAVHPKQAELLVTTKIWHDKDLKKLILNKKKDPPKIFLETFWELDTVDFPGQIESDRTFYIEKKWWQFWR